MKLSDGHINRYRALAAGFAITAFSTLGHAANEGSITDMVFSGSKSQWHSDVVQLKIDGGFSASDCDSAFAAIRKTDDHLVSAAMSAYLAGKRVYVWLDTDDRYFRKRCVISDIRIYP